VEMLSPARPLPHPPLECFLDPAFIKRLESVRFTCPTSVRLDVKPRAPLENP
jgi:hypothetical protein